MKQPITAAILIIGLLGAGASATLIDEEARVSEVLRARLQSVLDQRFGPNRCAAQVQASLKLSNDARGWVSRMLRPPEDPKPGAGYSWAWLGSSAATGGDGFVLPGYPDAQKPDEKAGSSAEPSAGAAAQIISAYGTELERVNVRIVLDSALPKAAEEEASVLAQETLGLSRVRGDQWSSALGALPGAMDRMLQDPATVSSLARTSAWAGAVLVFALMLAAGFWLLAGALRHGAERLSAAWQQGLARPMQVELRGLGGSGVSALAQGRPEEASQPLGEKTSGPAADAGPAEYMDIDEQHVDRLAHLLAGQSAEDVALIMPYLSPGVREKYLSTLPQETAGRVLLSMRPLRYVDPELLKSLRSELERRVRGVVGGEDQVLDLLRSADESSRRRMLEALLAQDPQAAAALRASLVFFEDLAGLSAEHLAVLAAAASVEDLATAAAEGPEVLRDGLRGALPGGAQRVFTQTAEIARGASDPARIAKARKAVLRAAEELIRAGRIARPAAGSVLGMETKG
ncbi:MAG: FliG C-terminal domain-containing protein [Elusimicrobiota bacterium]|jgi:flagellar motor switch protein FliG